MRVSTVVHMYLYVCRRYIIYAYVWNLLLLAAYSTDAQNNFCACAEVWSCLLFFFFLHCFVIILIFYCYCSCLNYDNSACFAIDMDINKITLAIDLRAFFDFLYLFILIYFFFTFTTLPSLSKYTVLIWKCVMATWCFERVHSATYLSCCCTL